MKTPIALILSLSCMSACGASPQSGNSQPPNSHAHNPQVHNQKSLLVASSKAVCQGMMQQLCLQVRASDGQGSYSPDYEFLYDGIADFDFVWGHSFELQIARESRNEAPQDAAATERRLVKVLGEKEDPVGRKYTFSGVVLNPYTVTFDKGEYHFLGEAFVCRDHETCEALATAHEIVPRADLVFSYLGNGDIQLVSWNGAE